MLPTKRLRSLAEWIRDDAHGFKTLTLIGFEGIVVEALRELRSEKDGEISDKDAEISGQQMQINQQRAEISSQKAQIGAQQKQIDQLKTLVCLSNQSADIFKEQL